MKNDLLNEKVHMTDSEWGHDTRVHRVIDMKLPLTWLISSAVAVVLALASVEWSIAAQNGKLEQLISQYSKIEQRLDQRDQRIDDMVKNFYEMQRVDDAQTLRLERIEQQLNIQTTTKRNSR